MKSEFILYVVRTNDGYLLSFPSTPELLALVRRLPEVAYDGAERVWRVPLSQSLYVKEFGELAVAKGFVKEVRKTDSLSEINPSDYWLRDLDGDIHMLLKPYDYQRKGIQYMISHKRTFNCDDMGLGKTMESIAAVAAARAYPCLVIAPAAMKITWKREFKKFIGKNAVVLDDSNKAKWHEMFLIGTCNVFITNYESIKKFFVIRENRSGKTIEDRIIIDKRASLFKSVVIDECHRCAHRSTKWSLYLERICKGKEYVFMLTGTPVVTSTKDLAQQLRIMGRLDDFGGPRRFATRFCSKDTTDARLSELNFLLWKTCYFRREKTLVLKELPEKIREYRMVELTNRKEYDEAERNLIGYLKNYMAVDDAKLKRAMRATAMVKIGICRRLSAKGKLKEGVEVINEALAGGHKVIVFTAHKDTVKDLQRYFPKSVKVTGEDSPEVKQKSVDKFQNNPDCRVIVLNIKSGGVGITLTAADIVLFLEYPWTASDCDQCECRAYRNGQKNAVTCIYLVGQNTFDERMQELVQKERVSSSLITGAEYNEDEYVVRSAIKYLIKKNEKSY